MTFWSYLTKQTVNHLDTLCPVLSPIWHSAAYRDLFSDIHKIEDMEVYTQIPGTVGSMNGNFLREYTRSQGNPPDQFDPTIFLLKDKNSVM